MSGPDLLPCPFCGGAATHAYTFKGWKVECEGRMGSCTMNARTHYQPTKSSAYDAWNRRATPAALAASPEVQALIAAATADLRAQIAALSPLPDFEDGVKIGIALGVEDCRKKVEEAEARGWNAAIEAAAGVSDAFKWPRSISKHIRALKKES